MSPSLFHREFNLPLRIFLDRHQYLFFFFSSGKLKTKRFNSLVDSINSKSLGPFGYKTVSSNSAATTNKSESSDSGTSGGSTVKLTEIDFADLAAGNNEKKVVLGKVICSVHSEESVPFTFCLTDRKGQCLAVNLYNLSPGKGVIIGK